LLLASPALNEHTVEDLDGSIYPFLSINGKCWMAKNLDVSKFRNGDEIPHTQSDEAWQKAALSQQPAWCYYDNNPENGKIYGKLYNWYAVSDTRGLVPLGWHVPTDNEWINLADYLGGQQLAGGKMKSISGWAENGNGNNSSNFSARPCGNRGFDGSFKNLGLAVFFWSASAYSVNHAWMHCLHINGCDVFRYGCGKSVGASVRCVMD